MDDFFFETSPVDVLSSLLVNRMCGVFNESKYKIHTARLRFSVTKCTIYVRVNKVLIIIMPLSKSGHPIKYL